MPRHRREPDAHEREHSSSPLRRERLPSQAILKLHIIRGVITAVMLVLFFWGIARVPLAEGIALSFIAPLITLYLAAVLLKEHVHRRAIIATLISLAGVGVILLGRLNTAQHGPQSLAALWGVGAILVSAVLYAFNLILQRQTAQVASPIEIAFFNTLVVAIVLGLGAPHWAHVPPRHDWPALIMAALVASTSLLLLSWAYARAEAKILVAVEYTAFIWAALFGYLVFAEPVTVRTLCGAVLIIIGCVVATWQERAPLPSAELGL